MCAVVVVEVEVVLELALEPCEADVQVAGEGRPPALLQDRWLQRLNCTVCLWSAGVDKALPGSEGGDGVAKDAGAKLTAVIGERPFEPPARGREVGRDPPRELGGLLARGVALDAGDEFGPGEGGGGDVDRG